MEAISGQSANSFELIYNVIYGSRAYGLTTDTSDIDTRGVFIQPPEKLFGLDIIETYHDANADCQLYSLRHFMHSLYRGSFNFHELLWVDPKDILYSNEAGNLLRANRQHFLSCHIFYKGIGFIKAMMHSLQKLSSNEQSLKFWKNISHAARISAMLVELAKTKQLNVVRKDDATFLLDIKTGKISPDKISSFISTNLSLLKDMMASPDFKYSGICQPPDKDFFNKFIVTTYLTYWRNHETYPTNA